MYIKKIDAHFIEVYNAQTYDKIDSFLNWLITFDVNNTDRGSFINVLQ